MKQIIFFVAIYVNTSSFAQEDSVSIKTPQKAEPIATKIFYSQKVINTKSVEVLGKGVMEFSVAHNFGDVGRKSDGTGIRTFFGLDKIADARIGFQIGLGDKLNVVLARCKGAGNVQQQFELGFKYQFLKQIEDGSKPFSLTMYVNDVVSAQKRGRFADTLENSFKSFSDRHSQIIQLLIARKFNKISIQLNPIYLHTNYVQYKDVESMFALGGAIRIPITQKFVLLADYFHSFRSESSSDFFKSRQIRFYDPLGVGVEIVTEGHVFHLNFTNATEILENRFIRNTTSRWGDWQFRWAFNLSRNFILFRDKRKS
jgi:hypothetical protein